MEKRGKDKSEQQLSDRMHDLQVDGPRGRGRGRGKAFGRDQRGPPGNDDRPGPRDQRGQRFSRNDHRGNDREDRREDRRPPSSSQEQRPQQTNAPMKQSESSSGSTSAWGQRGQQQSSQQGPPPGMKAPSSAPSFWGPKKDEQTIGQQKSDATPPPPGFTRPASSPANKQQQQQQIASTTRSDLNPATSRGGQSQSQGQQQQQQQQQRQQQQLSVTSIDAKKMPEKEKNRLLDLIPVRKNPNKAGTLGRKIRVRTNMMEITFNKNFKLNATHYDIKFDPDKPKFLKRLAFNAMRQCNFPNNWPAFDGRANVYSAGDLPFGHSITSEVEVIVDNESQERRNVKVTLTKANVIDISWFKNIAPGMKEHEKNFSSMQVLDVVLRCASYDRAIMVGRSFYQRPNNPVDLGTGMELWTGLFQSAVLGWKPYFNVDVAHKSFPKPQPVLQAIKDVCSTYRDPCNTVTADVIERNIDKINSYLRMLKVTYQLPNKPTTKRTVGINGLDKPPAKAIFKMANGQETDVLTYFSGAKNYKIKYPDLPLLWVGSRTKNPHILVPLELCTIASGNVTNRKLDEQQTSAMIKQAATPPAIRENKIMEAFNNMNFNTNKTMQEFGINVSGKFTEVDARVLEAPGLHDEKPIRVNKGVWNANKFYKTPNIPDKSWTILNLSRVDERVLMEFVNELKRNSNGMQIGEPDKPFKSLQLRGNDLRPLIGYLQDMKQRGLKLIVVVIPSRMADVYPKVKQVAELKVGILTQCIKDFTIERKMNKMTAGNILLKLNSKLNGINHIFAPADKPDCLKTPCMFIGADVTHPSPDATDIPSIAAVAASFDPTAFKYNVTIKLQPPRQEVISDLTEIIYNQLSRFMEMNKQRKPDKIIYYRDGVSEGQFPQIMHYELTAIRNACVKIGLPEKYEPKITFLVVQKRHHIRLFPTDKRNSDDRAGNVQAGTIVDTQITHPSHIDFYLVSHASIQGTAKPTKYRCLWDDNDMTEDQIEKLTYYLCHMFSRCTRSVSYPAPTYYAHLAAFRARALTHNVHIKLNDLPSEQRNKLTLCQDFHSNNPMFFV
ncbi:protein argonaute-2 [Aphidius gifuensis]|uniref:protein argonaute-2 n=1 Tax=Aphidius gifuensis TaxID=684658 RepID=UPI001CDD6768|nr:protein argonaute-2 [Aphidius gifuensis]